jgi:hypothetical protein
VKAQRTWWLRRHAFLAGLALLGVSGLCVFAQDTPPGTEEARLNTKVRLSPGETTLAEVMEALSRQTGLQIEASDSLRERRLIVLMEGLTARGALDTLAQLNNWTWRRTGPGHYLLTRLTIRRPQRLADVPFTMQAALPKDFRTYLGLTNWRKMPPGERAFAALQGAYGPACSQARQELVEALAPVLLHEAEIPYSRLTRRQQENLLFFLFFSGFRRTSELLYDCPGPHRIEPSQATLELQQGKVLMVEMYTVPGDPGSGIGFGQNVVDR